MIDRTDKEIRAEVYRLWNYDPSQFRFSLEELKVEVKRSPGLVRLTITAMFEPPGLTPAQLEGLAKFFGAKHAGDPEHDINEPGCETCDYGSRYGFEIALWGDA